MNMQTEDAGPNRPATIWRPLHAYLMAVVCLVIGVAIGYLVRGSAPPKSPATAAAMPAISACSHSSAKRRSRASQASLHSTT